MPVAERSIIHQNKRYPFFYLPAGGPELPESYVGLRFAKIDRAHKEK